MIATGLALFARIGHSGNYLTEVLPARPAPNLTQREAEARCVRADKATIMPGPQ